MEIGEARAEFVAAARSGDSARYVQARAALRVAEGRHKVTTDWDTDLHPRDSLGRFVSVLNMLRKQMTGSVVRVPNGDYVSRKRGKFRVHDAKGRVTFKSRSAEAAARHMASVYKPPPPRPLPKVPSLFERSLGGF